MNKKYKEMCCKAKCVKFSFAANKELIKACSSQQTNVDLRKIQTMFHFSIKDEMLP